MDWAGESLEVEAAMVPTDDADAEADDMVDPELGESVGLSL